MLREVHSIPFRVICDLICVICVELAYFLPGPAEPELGLVGAGYAMTGTLLDEATWALSDPVPAIPVSGAGYRRDTVLGGNCDCPGVSVKILE
jgi:hypothetical protein